MINGGINAEDSFGCGLTANYHIPNYQYDCKRTDAPYCPNNGNSNSFYSICLGAKTYSNKFFSFRSYEDALRAHNLTEKYVTLKLDCEGCEYDVFKALPSKYLNLIDQIII